MALVDYDDDSDTGEDSAEERESKPFSFTNFLFGNVDESGELEENYLDEEAKDHLDNLASRRIGGVSSQIQDVKSLVDDEGATETVKPGDGRVAFSPSAVDFSEITEAVEDDTEFDVRTSSPILHRSEELLSSKSSEDNQNRVHGADVPDGKPEIFNDDGVGASIPADVSMDQHERPLHEDDFGKPEDSIIDPQSIVAPPEIISAEDDYDEQPVAHDEVTNPAKNDEVGAESVDDLQEHWKSDENIEDLLLEPKTEQKDSVQPLAGDLTDGASLSPHVDTSEQPLADVSDGLKTEQTNETGSHGPDASLSAAGDSMGIPAEFVTSDSKEASGKSAPHESPDFWDDIFSAESPAAASHVDDLDPLFSDVSLVPPTHPEIKQEPEELPNNQNVTDDYMDIPDKIGSRESSDVVGSNRVAEEKEIVPLQASSIPEDASPVVEERISENATPPQTKEPDVSEPTEAEKPTEAQKLTEPEKTTETEKLTEPEKPTTSNVPSSDETSNEISSSSAAAADSNHKLNTPLASVLPPELSNINVMDVFPDFKPDGVLRFSRLFGPGRPSSLPKRWLNQLPQKPSTSTEIVEESDAEDRDDEEELRKVLEEEWSAEPISDLPATDGEGRSEIDVAVDNIPTSSKSNDDLPKRLSSSVIAPWRYGPAKFWYDQLNVDPTGENFDYGAKRTKNPSVSNSVGYGARANVKLEVDDEAYLMVSITNWEKDVIWNGANHKAEVDKLLAERRTVAGWIPCSAYRSAAAFLAPSKYPPNLQPPPLDLRNDSMFPAENEELTNGTWMKNIIWDASNVEELPEPAVLTLDPNDPNIVLDYPEEEEYETITKEPVIANQGREKKDVYKRSRMVLGKAGMLKDPDSPQMQDDSKDNVKDVFNLSYDEYYAPKVDESSLKNTPGAVIVQHAIPILRLDPLFAPPNMTLTRLRRYHRPELKKYSNGAIIQPGPHPIKNLAKHIRKKAKQRQAELAASGGGEMFFMREAEDLSVCDSELVLAEYSEEFPPLLGQTGMGTKVKNYFKRKPGKNEDEVPSFQYGELVQAHTSPFLGSLAPGQCVQAFENNMYRAPIYQHTTPASDFLVIRTRNHYYVRDIRVMFTVGQECPLIEVPAPNSKKAMKFTRDYLEVHIHRLFAKSTETPKKLKMEDMKKLLVHTNEATIRKRLKGMADYSRVGPPEAHFWTLKPEYRLPSEEELREKVSPEDYCAYYSMKSAEQRLKDAGYGEKLILAAEDDGDEEQQSKMDDEIKAAPWNTTRAFIAAMKNKCILQLTGDADPTGRGEGFSYVRVPSKAQDKDGPQQPKKMVTGTDADLRKLSLNNAKQLLRKYGVNEDKIKKLTRWEIIDLVRTLGTQQARQGNEESMSKFARGSRYSAFEQQEKYKEDCQRIFELQNRILGSEEVLSTDEESSDEEDDSDLEQLAGDLEEFIQSKKSSKEIRFEREEEERKELKKLLIEEEAAAKKLQKKKEKKEGAAEEETVEEVVPQQTRKLKIIRTFRDNDGREYDRVEYVSRPALIDAYVRIRTTKDTEFIQSFASFDSEKMRQKRKYTRRKVDPAKNQANENGEETSNKPRKPKKEKDLKVRCGACGGIGHMRTNRVCPLAGDSFNVAMTKEQEERQIGSVLEDSGLVKVEGAKITLKKEVLNQAEKIRRESLIVKIPKLLTDTLFDKEEKMLRKKEKRDRERLEQEDDRDVLRKKRRNDHLPEYLKKPGQLTTRRRTNPIVSLRLNLEIILNEIRDLPGCEPFRAPVSLKSCPDYLTIISHPMDLGTMRTKLNDLKYQGRKEFLDDLNQIVRNCAMYNGPNCKLTMDAQNMIVKCLELFGKDEERFKKLEKGINPLLDDNDQHALSYLFETIINNKLKPIEGSSIFHAPVNRKIVKDYYDIITDPMDLETMLNKVRKHDYQTAEQFLTDVELIRNNCCIYNGPESPFSKTAAEILRVAKIAVEEQMEYIATFENNIKATQEAALDEFETESVGTAGSDTERNVQSRLGSTSADFIEEDTRHTHMSDNADNDVFMDSSNSNQPSTSRFIQDDSARMDADDSFQYANDMLEPSEEDGSKADAEDTSSPPMRKKQLRLAMGANTYYSTFEAEAQDESEDAAVTSPIAGPSRVSTLEQDLHLSDSENEADEKKEDGGNEAADEDEDDGLWF